MTSGGIAGSRVSAIDRDGKTFLGGVVASSPLVREEALGLSPDTVATEAAAAAMASAVRAQFGSDIGLATTGDHDLGEARSGVTWLGMDIGGEVVVERVQLPGDRERVRQFSVISILNALRLRMVGDGRKNLDF